MKVLVIASRVPAVEKNGDQVVSFFRLIHLARGNTVELICYGDRAKPDDRDAARALEAAGITVHFIRWRPVIAFGQLLKAIPNPRMPFQCALFRSGQFQKTIDAVRARFIPDVLYSVMIRVLPNAGDYEGRLVVDMVDSMGLNFSRRAGMATGPKRWLLELESRRVAAFEKSVARRADRSFVVSRIDQKAIDADRVEVLPLGIDTQRFNKEEGLKSAPVIAFTGNMFYQPNVDAVRWFVEHCWPEIKASVAGVRLLVVGARPQPSVVALGKQDPAIEVMGRVPSVAAVLNTAMVAVAPMQSGSGMQFKILEAMACGVPVVATSIGLGDIGCRSGSEILVRDASTDFSREVVALLDSVSLRKKIGDAGMRYIEKHHSWDAINQHFAQECELI